MTAPRILFLGANDWANLSHGAARAINHVAGEQVARVWTLCSHPFGYPEDLVGHDGFEQARRLAPETEWVISTGDGDYEALRVMLRALGLDGASVRLATTHCGTAFRQGWRRFERLDRELGFELRFLGPDLLRLAPGDPRVRPLRVVAEPPPVQSVLPPTGPIRIAHAPSLRAKKGTDVILAVLEHLRSEQGIEVDLIEGAPHAECLERLSRCHVFIDQLQPAVGGFGRSSTEAMSRGCATLCSIGLVDERCWHDFERPPIVGVSTADDLERELRLLVADPDRLHHLREQSLAWIRENASYEAVGRYWLEQLEQVD